MNAQADWNIPEPLSVAKVRLDEESESPVRRYGNPDAGTRLVLSHANGLAIDLYYPFWSLLAEEFDLMIFDLRNHGWNPVGALRNHNIPRLIVDHDLVLEAIDRIHGTKPTVGVFHSLSALVALLSMADRYAAMVLFDPPICKSVVSEAEFDEAVERIARKVRRRGDTFQSEEEFADLLAYMPTFLRVLPGVRQLTARTTLRRRPGGDLELRCPRHYEAQIVDYVRSYAPLFDLETLTCPTKVIGADPTLPSAYLPTYDLRHVLSVDYDFVPDATHLLQLEQPTECVSRLRSFLDDRRLA
ncbi:MAG: alpha/beta hydrolase [Boseongicola sp.]|nr:alpha/beta hydrolase [Boseongicola sp.]